MVFHFPFLKIVIAIIARIEEENEKEYYEKDEVMAYR